MTLFKVNDYESGAEFSDDRVYRYVLWRKWNKEKPKVVFIGLNPSTADEEINDPTITRCENFALKWKFGGLFMLNIFAFRATDPRRMKAALDPVGPGNDDWIIKVVEKAGPIVLAWGNNGDYMNRGKAVIELLHEFDLYYLGDLTKGGHPRHPLYLKADLEPKLFKRGIK